ncbi:hypothetical protein [Mangrovibacillus cuniculi]|uniref:Uncharacterized protein n=1 Tax=Mangrovibacillus cuniculi TaxID=2593652 RepID=A0A7S8HGF1_9BACI|nr:hypothetical protein [Mangrovibacillus cuniculi]QPC47360.1 hypothetical protein G8O30_10575 [Mangrovibacillus cuniculi]
MMDKYYYQIEKIKKMDTEKYPMLLLKSLLMSEHFERTLKYFFPNGSTTEEVMEHYYRNENERYLYKQLLIYLGFEEDDEIAEDIIDEKYVYLNVHDKGTVRELKTELIKWVEELSEFEANSQSH